MSELMDRILAGKRESCQQLAALPFARKLELVEKMRDRSLLIASSSLRRQRQPQPPQSRVAGRDAPAADRTENPNSESPQSETDKLTD